MKAETAKILIDALIAQFKVDPMTEQSILIRQHNDNPNLVVAELWEVDARDFHESGIGHTPEEALEELARNITEGEDHG